MIIDFHTHCFPDFLAERAIASLSAAGGGMKANTDGTVSGLKKSMAKNGIDKSVVLQIATKPSQVPNVNTWAIENNGGDIVTFGSIHPLYEDWKSELDRLSAAGVKGIKLHPEYQQFYVDAEEMRPVYRYAGELGLIIIFHAGADIGFPPPVHCTPEMLLRVADDLPRGRTVLAHLGGWKMWDEVDELMRDTHFIYDTAFCNTFLSPEKMRGIILRHGVDKIVMGSDSPWEDQADTLSLIRSLDLSPNDEAAILGGNAARILKL